MIEVKASNDNVFISVEKSETVKTEAGILIKEASDFKIVKATVSSADIENEAVKNSKISIGCTIIAHKTSIITEMIGPDEISYIKASGILGII